jgi:hypothetical protein
LFQNASLSSISLKRRPLLLSENGEKVYNNTTFKVCPFGFVFSWGLDDRITKKEDGCKFRKFVGSASILKNP